MHEPPPEPAEQAAQPGEPPVQPISPAQPAEPVVPPHVGTTTRRWFLAGGIAVVFGAAGGAAFELTRNDGTTAAPPPAPPATLVAAVATERALIADLNATTGGTPAVRRVIVQARADHAAHLRTLAALLDRYAVPAGPSSPPATTSAVRGTPRTLAQLRAAEQRAAADAAARAARLSGDYAALLASIAACEAGHAELFR